MTDADERRVSKALQGAEFPAGKAQLYSYAEERQADPRALRALASLPEGTYDSADEVEGTVPQRPDEQVSG